MHCALICALLDSCHTDELCYSHPHKGDVKVVFDWSDAPDAAPEGMRILAHSAYANTHNIYDVAPSGGYIDMVNDTYSIIAFNNDSEWVTHQNSDDFHTHVATTRECDILEPMYGPGISSVGIRSVDNERVVVAPDMLYGVADKDRPIIPGDVVTLKPQQLTCNYTFEFRNVGSVSYIAKLSASISGMSPGVVMSTGQLLDEPCTIALDAEVDNKRAAGNTISGHFCTFGHHPDISASHRMALYIVLTNGQKYKYVTDDCLDVTEQIHNAPDKRNVHIIVEGIELPEPINNGGGFLPHVDDWDDIETEINM